MSESKACPECRHIFPSGARCHSPALRDKPLCYYHSRNRTIVDTNRYRSRSVALPPLEDRGAIQIAINEVLAAFAAGKIDRRAVWPYLYAIQMASQNLARATNFAASDPVEMFEEHFEEVLVTDQPVEQSDSASLQVVPEVHLSNPDPSETHEYDAEPPDPEAAARLEKIESRQRGSAFSSRGEANQFYEMSHQWLEQRFLPNGPVPEPEAPE